MTTHSIEQISFHLQANIYPPLNENALDGILKTVELFNAGEIGTEDSIVDKNGKPISDVTVGEMFNDLQIEIENQ